MTINLTVEIIAIIKSLIDSSIGESIYESCDKIISVFVIVRLALFFITNFLQVFVLLLLLKLPCLTDYLFLIQLLHNWILYLFQRLSVKYQKLVRINRFCNPINKIKISKITFYGFFDKKSRGLFGFCNNYSNLCQVQFFYTLNHSKTINKRVDTHWGRFNLKINKKKKYFHSKIKQILFSIS